MFGLSKMWVYGLAAGALLLAILLGVRAIYNAGYDKRDVKAKQESAAAVKKAEDAKAALKTDIAVLQAKSDQEKVNAKQEIDRLRVQLSSGTVRLRVPATASRVAGGAPAASGEARAQPGQAATDSTAAVGPGFRPNPALIDVELPPHVSIELLAIAADGDAAIRDLNECIDSYEALRKRLHGLQRTD